MDLHLGMSGMYQSLISIHRHWNSACYKQPFWKKIWVIFVIPYALLFFSFHIWNILLLLVNNLCLMKRMRFLQHEIASGSPFFNRFLMTGTTLLKTPWAGLSDQSFTSLHALHFSKIICFKLMRSFWNTSSVWILLVFRFQSNILPYSHYFFCTFWREIKMISKS